jgi:beta-mannosidase
MKGANYIPQHSFVSELKESNYETIVKLAKDANMNMLRVWGGGLYEDDAFYEACDRNGILVWQDFMFACAMYPGDPAFVENVKQEVAQQAQRLRNHTCLALWCGNNEIDEGWHNWGWQKQYHYSAKDSALIWNNYKTLFHEAIPRILKQYDPHTSYWPSSPSIGWGHEESLLQGDAHYWGVWWGMEPLDIYQKKTGRFMSEYGFQGMPSVALFKTFCDTSELNLNSASVKAHQKHPTGYETIKTYMERDYKVPENFEEFVYISQLLQRDAMKAAIEAHRRAMPYCMGTLYWQFNDCWPVTSWSALDNTYRPKALYYETKKLYNDVSISIHKNRSEYEVFVISDKTTDEEAVFSMTLKNTKGDTILHKQDTVMISANKSVIYKSLRENELSGLSKNELYLSCSLKTKEGRMIARNHFFFVKPKDILLHDPNIALSWSKETKIITLRAKSFVKDLYIFSDQQDLELPYNFIDLEPGQTVQIKFNADIKPGTTLNYFSLYHSSLNK